MRAERRRKRRRNCSVGNGKSERGEEQKNAERTGEREKSI